VKPKNKIVGLVPAAGFATRISSLECSKEIYPISHPGKDSRVVSSYLFDNFKAAGISQAYVVLRTGKWDIPEYFENEPTPDLNLAFVVTDATDGVPQTINKAYSFINSYKVAFGFPDILSTPPNSFDLLMQKQETTNAELVLGLYRATKPNKVDMVRFDKLGVIKNIHIKPASTNLTYTWINAVWTPVFTDFIHEYLDDFNSNQLKRTNFDRRELYLGDVIREAIHSGLKATYVKFETGSYVDIGTPEELKKVTNPEWLQRFYSDE